jgi:membrane protease YdiL (CAAX protease family)
VGQALFLTALLWLATQMIALLISGINGDIHLDPLWSERGVSTVIGALIGQLLGNAFNEEMLYRGFYLSQFYLKIRESNERRRLAWAILAMLGLFILSHIPNRIFHGYSLADLPLDFALLFAWGLFFTAIYLLSGNLFLAIGVHALVNRPALITEAPFPPQALLFVLTCILLAVMRRQSRKRVQSLSTV